MRCIGKCRCIAFVISIQKRFTMRLQHTWCTAFSRQELQQTLSAVIPAVNLCRYPAHQRSFLFVVQLLLLVLGLAGEVDAELAEDALVDLGENDGGVRLEALEAVQLADGSGGIRVVHRRDG